MNYVKEIGLVGPSFCGSSLLNLLFDAMWGVIGIGESHWILDGDDPRIFGDDLLHGNRCIDCYPNDCSIFTDRFLDDLRLNPKNWWQKFANQSGAVAAVVSSDKNPQYYQRLGIPDVLVLIYKDFRALISSHLIHRFWPKGDAPSLDSVVFSDESVLHYLKKFSDYYNYLLKWCFSVGGTVVVFDYTAFTCDPE